MGWKSWLAGIGLGVAGAVTGQPGLIGAGINVIGAGRAADASKDAAATQSAAGDKAIQFLGGINQQQRTDLNPYMALGGNAAGRLNSLMGGGPLMPFAGSAPPPMTGALPPQAAPQAQVATANPLGEFMIPGVRGTYGLPTGVLMKAPDGTTKQVPADQVQAYLAKGATVVK